MKRISVLLVFSLVFMSCSSIINSVKNQNPFYANFTRTSSESFKNTKQINSYDYNENNVKYFQQNGYVMVGYAALRSTFINYQEVVNAGCWNGADLVLYKYNYVGTSSGRAVLPFYNSGETYTINSTTNGSVNATANSSASAYGSNGYAFGNSTTNMYGTYNSKTNTTITTPNTVSYYSVPYSNDYYDQYAVYFVKKYFKINEYVSLYEKANTNSKLLIVINSNDWFECISYTQNFVKVKYKNSIGFILNNGKLK